MGILPRKFLIEAKQTRNKNLSIEDFDWNVSFNEIKLKTVQKATLI